MSQASGSPGSPSSHGPRRRALVTGASAGIGRAFAERLARDQFDLVLVARSGERLEALAKRLAEAHGAGTETLVADLTEAAEVARVEERLRSEPIDLLVNNAGFGTVGPFAELDPDGEEREVRLNVLAVLRLARAALPGMLERGRGDLIQVSSLAGEAAAPYTATYAATKAFVTSLSESLAEETRGSGVRVQALLPGFTRTEFQDRAGVDSDAIPGFAWMEATEVVEASLAALEAGKVVCVPGALNKVLGTVTRMAPRGLVARAVGETFKRSLGKDS